MTARGSPSGPYVVDRLGSYPGLPDAAYVTGNPDIWDPALRRSPRPRRFSMSDIVLEIKALTRRFGAFTAVDALTLSVNAGEVFGLLGSNGAGKTTTAGMHRPRRF